MKITFKLFASLGEYLPPEARRDNRITLDVAPGTTITSIIEPLAMPPKSVHLVLINGAYVPPEERATRPLVAGDVLAIWPPIAGG